MASMASPTTCLYNHKCRRKLVSYPRRISASIPDTSDDKTSQANESKNKLQKQNLAGQHSDVLENLTPTVRKRVEVLREIEKGVPDFWLIALKKILKKMPKKGSKNTKPITKTEDCESFFASSVAV